MTLYAIYIRSLSITVSYMKLGQDRRHLEEVSRCRVLQVGQGIVQSLEPHVL